MILDVRFIMEDAKFDFQLTRQSFCDSIQEVLDDDTKNLDLKVLFDDEPGCEADKKLALDQAYRDKLQQCMTDHDGDDGCTDLYTFLLSMVAESVQSDICSTSTLFIMLSDLFDTVTLDRCDEIFQFVEERVDLWKLEIFYNAGKNYLLRMCNDLLRRLSKSQNMVFCGRIQLFLARLFPLEEKSGLNLMSQFNLENVTVFIAKSEDYDKAVKMPGDEARMDVEEGEMDDSGGIPIDYNLYRKFWSLQDFFRRPGQCFEKVAFKTFTNYSDEVLNCFSSYKLDDTRTTQRKLEQLKEASTSTYFAKYLTSEKLLDLQLSDSNFRRYVLVQFLILFQYLNAQVRFKSTSQVLTDDQTTWTKETTEKVFRVLRETPPDGDQFARAIEHILNREENWNCWKNDGCANFIRKNEDAKTKLPVGGRGRKRSFGDDVKVGGSKLIKMGNPELTRLWNLSHDNMEAARSDKRNFLPTMEDYFETAIEQADPEGGIEKQYKLINNATFGWKALRLLARKSQKFFGEPTSTTYWANQPKNVPSFLEATISKMAKEMPYQTTPVDEMKTDLDDGAMDNGAAEDNLDSKQDLVTMRRGPPEREDYDDETGAVPRVALPDLQRLAEKVSDNWKKLAVELNFQEDDVTYFESAHSGLVEQALKMLQIWQENEGDKATVATLRLALVEIGQAAIATAIFGDKEDSP